MKVLFTNGYFYRFDRKQWAAKQPYPPLGTITAAAWMRKHGYQVGLLDNNLVVNVAETIIQLEQEKPDFLVIYDDGFNYLTKMCLTNMREAVFEILAYAKKMGIHTIVNSSDSTDHFEEYHSKLADYVIHGEGEVTLLELVRAIENQSPLQEITGISYVSGGSVLKNLPRKVKHQLDELPMAAWDLVDVEAYRKIWMDAHGYFSLNVATTRGCPFKCNWCAKPIYGNRYNSRTPQHVLDEIKYLIENYGVHYFWMCDDIFGLKPGWVQEFANLKHAMQLQFEFKIQSRVDLMLKDTNLQALVDAGLHTAWVGAESGSQKILDAMDKGTQVEQIYEASRKLKAHGVKVAFFLQFGYLGETYQDIRKTLTMVLDLMPDDIGISVSYPLPGTKFYDKVKSQLDTKANWTDSDDLDLMFANTYPPVFYKTLHRYVHHRYLIKRGMLALGKFFVKPREKARAILQMTYHLPLGIYRHILLNFYLRTKS